MYGRLFSATDETTPPSKRPRLSDPSDPSYPFEKFHRECWDAPLDPILTTLPERATDEEYSESDTLPGNPFLDFPIQEVENHKIDILFG